MSTSSNTSTSHEFYLRAQSLNYQGNGASAIKILAECLRQDPDDATAAKLLKLIKRSEVLKKEGNDAYGEGKYEAALEAYRAALALDPANNIFNSRILCNYAIVLFNQGKFGEAVGKCNLSLALDESYVKAYRHRAACYMKMGDIDSIGSAIKAYTKAKELLRGAAISPENKEQLKKIEHDLNDAQNALNKAKIPRTVLTSQDPVTGATLTGWQALINRPRINLVV